MQVADRPFLQISDIRRRHVPHFSRRQRSRILTSASLDERQQSGAKLFGLDVQPFSPTANSPGSQLSSREPANNQSLLTRALDSLRGQSAALRQTAAAAAIGAILLAGVAHILYL